MCCVQDDFFCHLRPAHDRTSITLVFRVIVFDQDPEISRIAGDCHSTRSYSRVLHTRGIRW